MIDPLTAATSVAGLLSLVIQVSQILYEQIRTVKSAPQDARELLDEFELLCQVLTSLEALLKTSASGGSSFKDTSVLLKAIDGCREKIKAVQQRLEKLVQSQGLAKLVERGKWYYDHEEHQKVITIIHRYLGVFQMSLNVNGIALLSKSTDEVTEQLKSLKLNIPVVHTNPQDVESMMKRINDVLDLLPSLSAIAKDVIDISNTVRRWDEKWQDQEGRDVVDWLSSLNFWVRQDDIFARKEEGTGGWIFEEPAFEDWMNGSERILWCPGMPGAGKTILASAVIHHLRKCVEDENTAVAFIYCNYKERESQTTVNLMASLLQQLILRKSEIPNKVRTCYKMHSRNRTRPTITECSELLQSELITYSRAFIIVDALDEYDETGKTRGAFISQLKKMPTNISLMVTSRPSSSIEEELQPFRRLEIRARDSDVKTYLERCIERETRLRRHVSADPALKTVILDTIVRKVNGMFLLAQLHMESLGKKHNRKAVREALQTLPKGLDATYDEAVARIYNQDADDVDLAEKVLYWLSYSQRPLTVKELQHAITVMSGDHEIGEDDLCDATIITSVCAGLVLIDHEGDVFRLVHYTTQEYFERKRQEKFPEGQTSIVATCLAYLSLDAFKAGYCPSNEEMQDRLDRYPFLSYAAQYWGIHAVGEPESKLENQILTFLALDTNLSYSSQAMKVDSYRFGYWSQLAPKKLPGIGIAATFGLTRVIKLLLAQNTTVDDRDSEGRAALHHAAYRSHEGTVRVLIEAGADIEARDGGQETALHQAALRGHEGTLRVLLEAGADIEARDGGQRTALHHAAHRGYEDTVRVLLEAGADIEARDGSQETALHRAALWGHEGTVRVLLDAGADIEARDRSQGTALHQAAYRGHENTVRVLLEAGADIEARDGSQETALHRAALRGHEGTVRVMLDAGADIEARDGGQETALHQAAHQGHEDTVRVLLEAGADIEARDGSQETALRNAALWGHEGTVRVMLDAGADIEARDGSQETALQQAALRGHEGTVRVLLEAGADIEARDRIQGTALHRAAHGGQEGTVRVLLEAGADIEAREGSQRTALHQAALWGHEGTVRVLLEAGADIEARDGSQETALHRAALWGHENTVRVLLEAGADIEARDGSQRTALHRAALWGHEGTVRVLLEAGADIEARDGSQRTALHRAALWGHEGTVRVLLEAGADIEARDGSQWTALHQAALWGHEGTVRVLLEAGADIEARDGSQWTALHRAALWGEEGTVYVLLEAGADVKAIDIAGRIPLQMAAGSGREAVVKLLKSQADGKQC